jgi:hypothetical protein
MGGEERRYKDFIYARSQFWRQTPSFVVAAGAGGASLLGNRSQEPATSIREMSIQPLNVVASAAILVYAMAGRRS